MGNSKRIALLTCYFGKLPWYFSYFIHSCKYNPSVSFFIVTDDDSYQGELPENVKLIYKTLADVSKLATEKLGFEVHIKYGYKLCDFKPAYRLIFSEVLADKLFSGLYNQGKSFKKSALIYRATTIISPFYEQFLIKVPKGKLHLTTSELIKENDTNSTVYYYLINNDQFDYLFIHHQITTKVPQRIDSVASKYEFLFIMKSIRFN